MDIGLIERIGPLTRAGLMRGSDDVSPALGVQGAQRMLDDSYTKRERDQRRGMEEEAEEISEEAESTASKVDQKLNLFA